MTHQQREMELDEISFASVPEANSNEIVGKIKDFEVNFFHFENFCN